MPMTSGRVIHRTGDGRKRALMQNDIDVLHGVTRDVDVAHIRLDKLDAASDIGKVRLLAREQVVYHPDKASLPHKLPADIGADEPRPSRNKESVHHGTLEKM